MLLNVEDVQRLLKVPQSTAYQIIRQLNAELKKDGYLTIRGRIPGDYLANRFRLDVEEIGKQGAI